MKQFFLFRCCAAAAAVGILHFLLLLIELGVLLLVQNTTQKNLLIFGNQQANRIVFIFTQDEKWQKCQKTTDKHWQTIEVSLFSENSHTSKRTQGTALTQQEHTCEQMCLCAFVCVFTIYTDCTFAAWSQSTFINEYRVYTQEWTKKNTRTSKKLRSPILMIHSDRRKKYNRIQYEEIFFCFFWFLFHYFYCTIVNWISVWMNCCFSFSSARIVSVCVILIFFFSNGTNDLNTILNRLQARQQPYRLVQHSNHY